MLSWMVVQVVQADILRPLDRMVIARHPVTIRQARPVGTVGDFRCATGYADSGRKGAPIWATICGRYYVAVLIDFLCHSLVSSLLVFAIESASASNTRRHDCSC